MKRSVTLCWCVVLLIGISGTGHSSFLLRNASAGVKWHSNVDLTVSGKSLQLPTTIFGGKDNGDPAESYKQDMEMESVLYGPMNTQLLIESEYFAVEDSDDCMFDYLQLSETNKFCCSKPLVFITNQSFTFATFKSDNSYEDRGFKLNINAHTMKCLFIISILLASICKDVMCLYCLVCNDVHSATDCHEVKDCGPGEVCFASLLVSETNHVYRNMGCRPQNQCSSGGLIGRRQVNVAVDYKVREDDISDGLNVRSLDDLVVCDSCCDTPWCQTTVCHDTGFSQNRGPICFKCEHKSLRDKCPHITVCGRDEVCYQAFEFTMASSEHFLEEQGCYHASACNKIGLLHGNGTCWKCCGDDLCNDGCRSGSGAATASTTLNPITTPCVDLTASNTCRLSASIFCQDVNHARESGCMHYCGFC